MTIRSRFQTKTGTQGRVIGRMLRRALRKLSCIGDERSQGGTELCRLSGLPSCCFAHVAEKRK